jgi:hypothetical protein
MQIQMAMANGPTLYEAHAFDRHEQAAHWVGLSDGLRVGSSNAP